jgi:hypothetical protein
MSVICDTSLGGGREATAQSSVAVQLAVRAASPAAGGAAPVASVTLLARGSGGGSGRQAPGLVLYLSCDLLQLGLELTAVVSAEEQLAAGCQHNAQVCLGAAPVAAVGCGQRARGGQNCSHVASSLARRAVVSGSTSNRAQNVPACGFSFVEPGLRVGPAVEPGRGSPSGAGGGVIPLLERTCPTAQRFMPAADYGLRLTRSWLSNARTRCA